MNGVNLPTGDIKPTQLALITKVYLPGILGTLIVLGGLYFSWMWFGQIGQTRNDLAKSRARLEELNQRVSSLQTLRDGDLGEMQDVVEQALPSEKPVFELLTSLSNLAVQSGVRITDLQTSPGSIATDAARLRPAAGASSANLTPSQQAALAQRNRNRPAYESLKVTLVADGQFEALNGFLLSLGNLLPLVDLAEVRLAPTGPVRDGVRNFSGELDLLVYWMPYPELSDTQKIEAARLSQSQRDAFEAISTYQYLGRSGF